MTKQSFMQLRAYYLLQADKAQKAISDAEKEYIKANATYPVGSELKIDHIGKERLVRIQSYNIDENGVLIPVFETLEGKSLFIEKATVIGFLKNKL